MTLCFTELYKWENDDNVYQTFLFKNEDDRNDYENLCVFKTGHETVKDALESINDWDYEGFENKSGAIFKFRAVKKSDGNWEALIRDGKYGVTHTKVVDRLFSTPNEAVNYLKQCSLFSINELM